MKILISAETITKIIITRKVTFEPIRYASELVSMIRRGHTSFFSVRSIKRPDDAGFNVWTQEHKAIRLSCDNSQHSLRAYSTRKDSICDIDGFFLGDFNISGGSYNNHQMFTTKEEADMYATHVINGGKLLSRFNGSKGR